MRVITANVNGIRSAARKGFFTWMLEKEADFICLQETKAHMHTLDDPIFQPTGYTLHHTDAKKPGYSGVAIYTKHKPQRVIHTLGWEVADHEGRYLQLDYTNISIVSVYLPSGSSGEERQAIKMEFLAHYEKNLQQIQCSEREVIICGDWNIVHKERDIKNWKGNQKNSGCLPEERAWLDKVFGPIGWVDAFRQINQESEQYTWWSNRGQAWAKNVGWRIDYQVVSAGLADKVRSAHIYKEARFSDHAPLVIDYDFTVKS